MTAPRVSIVIPTYNHAQFLGPALESVRAQTMPDWECIVVNNYSTDNTEAVVEALDDSRIRLINFRNEGVIAASRNMGIYEARSEWVAFLDSDDLWDRDKLECCLTTATPEYDVISHPERFMRDDRIIHTSRVATAERVRYRTLLFNGNCLSPSGTLVRKSWLDRLGGFDTDRALITAEDFDLWLRLAQNGARFTAISKCLGNFRVHDGQNSGSVVRHRDASLTVLERHLAKLTTCNLVDRLRGRRARALVIYAAGRSLQKAGQRTEALAEFAHAARLWPFEPRLAAAMALSLFWY